MQEVLDTIAGVPGIARVLRSDHLMDPEASDDPVVRAARLSQFPGRSGDLILVPKAYWLMSTGTTTHGTYYGYDQHVPVVLYGAGDPPGPLLGGGLASRHRPDAGGALWHHDGADRRPRAVRSAVDGTPRARAHRAAPTRPRRE